MKTSLKKASYSLKRKTLEEVIDQYEGLNDEALPNLPENNPFIEQILKANKVHQFH